MKIHARFILVLMAFTWLLSACGSAPAAVPTSQPTAAAAAATTAPTTAATVQPTATFERVTDLTPTAAEPTVGAPAANAPDAAATLAWRDKLLRNDGIILTTDGLPPPASGNAYGAWLTNKDGGLALGALSFGENGNARLEFQAADQQNLLSVFDQIFIVQAPQAEITTNAKNVVLSGGLPPQALVHIRHLLFSIGITPGKIGFVLGLRQETDELLRHAQFLQDAYDTSDFALERVHAEHIINIIRGSEARDGNGDGKIQNPGDGYGLLTNGQQDGYIKGMIDHAKLAAATPDATAAIKLHAGHIQIVGENTRERVDQVRALAEQVLAAAGRDGTQQPVQAILSLAQQTIQGVDANGDEQIGPIPGEGGVLTAYQHAQLMAGITLAPATGAVAAVPAAAPTADAAAPAAQTIKVSIGDNSFDPKKLTVPVGATVIWTNAGQRAHTVTADDTSFDSGNLDAGATFTFTFTKAGTFPYYCDYHGGAGGQGMSATIIVTDGAAAVPPAPQAAAPTTEANHVDHGAATHTPVANNAVAAEIGDNTFTPKEISIPVGATVNWKSVGQRPHTVTADDGSFKSATLKNGDTFSQKFDKPGLYAFYCEFHGGAGGQGMSGVVKVGDAAAAPAAPAVPGVPAPTTPPVPAAAPVAILVSMKDFEFDAPTLNVKVGSAVTWKNDGAKRHSATAVDGSFDTGLFGTGESKTVTFNTPGTFAYFCQLHGDQDGKNGMVGVVTVEP